MKLIGVLIALLAVPCWGQFDSTPQTRLTPIETKTGFDRPTGQWRLTPRAEYHNAIVRVQCPDGAAGSGCIVATEGPGVFVLTNHHVVSVGYRGPQFGFARATFRTITFRGVRDTITADVVWSDPDLDIALIYAPNANAQNSLPIAASMPPVGADIEFAGFGGPVSSLRSFVGKRVAAGYRCSIDQPVVSGDSGGPFLHNGQVVGVNFGAPGQSGNRGVINTRNGPWHMTGPASSNVDCKILAEVFTQQCAPYGCQPIIGPRPVPSPGSGAVCKDGADGEPGTDGLPGTDGKDGVNGSDGKDGADGSDGKDASLLLIRKIIREELAKQPTTHIQAGYYDDSGNITAYGNKIPIPRDGSPALLPPFAIQSLGTGGKKTPQQAPLGSMIPLQGGYVNGR